MLSRITEKKLRQSAMLSSALNNSVVIVTGASSGIGAATAREFARHGAYVSWRRDESKS
jgi:NAD(P)-dependent dehydrogenase (short-subunit alcohol dehydrogenase family)